MLQFKVSSRKQTIGKNKGKMMYYAQCTGHDRLTSDKVERMISEKTSLTRGDVRHAMTSLAEIVSWGLSQGMCVDLGDLGTFQVSVQGRMMEKREDVKVSSLKKPRLRFNPRQTMRLDARAVSLVMVDGSTTIKQPDASGGAGSSPSQPGSSGVDSGL